MAEENFEQLLNESMKSVRPGEIITGKVVTVNPSEAVLNIGYKYDAFLSAREFDGKDEDLTQQLHEGDEVEVKVLKIDNKDSMITVSKRRVAAEKASEQLQKAFEDKTVLTGVAEAVKGGLTVEVEGSRVFIPGSLVSDTFVKDLSEFNGQEIEFVITEFDPRKHRIIGDRKQIVTQKHEADKAKLLEDLKVGDIIEGTVRSITTFGAFVDLGGADGLLHVTQMGWGRVGNPKELYHRGDKVRVFVQDIKGDRISLSTKFPDEDPWNSVENTYSLGQKVTGKVARMTDFGAFVALDDNIDGLLHVSQISNERIEKPADVLSVGQEVTVMVTAIDVDKHRISLSMKDLEEAPAAVSEDAE